MEIRKNKLTKKDYFSIIVGTFMMAVAVNIVYEPMDMVTGGLSGLAIVIKYFTSGLFKGGIPIWLTNTCINAPLFFIAYKIKGKQFIKTTLFSTVCFTIALYIVPSFKVEYKDFLLASVFGGVLSGFGLGLVFSTGNSTGGTDLLGVILQRFLKHYSVAQLLMFIDGTIVLIGALIFGVQKALYAVIAVFITSKVMDGILEGLHFAKMAYIISLKEKEIADDIMNELDRGATRLEATGMYSGNTKNMLLCVVSAKEIVKLIEIVARNDPKAFIIISDIREVMGEGFIEYRQ